MKLEKRFEKVKDILSELDKEVVNELKDTDDRDTKVELENISESIADLIDCLEEYLFQEGYATYEQDGY